MAAAYPRLIRPKLPAQLPSAPTDRPGRVRESHRARWARTRPIRLLLRVGTRSPTRLDEVLVLRPDRERAGKRKGDGRPVLAVAPGHAPLGLFAFGLVDGRGLPVDRHNAECREEETGVEPTSPGQRGQMLGDLLGHLLGGEADLTGGRGKDDAGTPADQRRQDDVRVSDDDGRQ